MREAVTAVDIFTSVVATDDAAVAFAFKEDKEQDDDVKINNT